MRSHLLLSMALAGAVFLPAQMQSPQGVPMGQPPVGSPRAMDPMNRPGYPDDTNAPSAQQNKIDEKRFVKDALTSGMAEVELSKVAAQKASSDSVKQFARNVVDERSKANEELKQIATKQDINVPEALDAKHQTKMDKLSQLSGANFDREYLKDEVKNQQSDLREYQREAQGGNDPEIKSFASKVAPSIEEHVRMAKVLEKGKKTASANSASGSRIRDRA